MNDFLGLCETIGQIIAGIVVSLYFCKTYLEKHFKHTDVSKGIVKQNKIDVDILNAMEHAKEQLSADRIQVYEFHNGEHYANYRSAYKMSCTYEVVKYGSHALRDKCMQIPISCMPGFIKEITEIGHCECTDINNLRETMPSTYNFKNNLGIKSFYDLAIHNKNGDTVGFVAVQWDTKQRICPDEEVIQKLVWLIEEQLNNINC